MKTYILKPTMTFETVANASAAFKPRDKESATIAEVIAPAAKPKSGMAVTPPRRPRASSQVSSWP